MSECKRPPAGWRCTRGHHEDGPCAAVPTAPVHEVADVTVTIDGEGANVSLFQSVRILTTKDVDDAFRLRDAINAEAETWLHYLYAIPRALDVNVDLELRRWWWLGHGCPMPSLYGDDGEMQCGTCHHDFKRESLADLRDHVYARKMAQLAAHVPDPSLAAPVWIEEGERG